MARCKFCRRAFHNAIDKACNTHEQVCFVAHAPKTAKAATGLADVEENEDDDEEDLSTAIQTMSIAEKKEDK